MTKYTFKEHQKIYQIYKTFRKELPYSFILLNELHASENDHTRILISLLKYPGEDKQYPLLRSFLEQVVLKNWDNSKEKAAFIKDICTHVKDIPFNKQLIDAQIGTASRCVIIENKVCDATDQDKQLQRYAQTIKHKGVKTQNIWILYLTGNGGKKPSPNSLTAAVMKDLNIKVLEDREQQIQKGNFPPEDETQPVRFVPANYAYDILPWLKKIIGQIPYKDSLYLIPGLKQYIAFLQNLYFILPEQKNMTEKLMQDIINSLSAGKTTHNEKESALYEYYEDIQAIVTTIQNRNNEQLEKILNTLKETTENYLKTYIKTDILTAENREAENQTDPNWMWFQLGKDPASSNIHFEWNWTKKELLAQGQITFVFHIEKTKQEKEYILNAIKEAKKENYRLVIPDKPKTGALELFHQPVTLNLESNDSIASSVKAELDKFKDEIAFLIAQTTPGKITTILQEGKKGK